MSSVTAANVAAHDAPLSVEAYAASEGLWPIERELIAGFCPPPPGRVLELGCGTGRATTGLVSLGYDVIGIDLSVAMLRPARSRYPGLDFREMDATSLAFAPGDFDVVFFGYNGLDYIYPETDRLRCFAEAFRVLRPGGVFLFSTHNLLGALFSGGFFYVRGYVNAVRLLARQIDNPLAREWYVDYDRTMRLYSAPPSRTTRHLRHAGFVVECIRGATGEQRPGRIVRHQAHVYFVATKPS